MLAISASACVHSGRTFTAEQQAVFDAMQAWSRAVERQDTQGMWEMLSSKAQEFYRAELAQTRNVLKMEKAALASDSLLSEEARQRKLDYIKTLPEDPDSMTARDFYAWRVKGEMTPENTEKQTRLFARSNLRGIRIDDDRATVELEHGRQPQLYWRKEGKDWKFDLDPSMLRVLEARDKRQRQP